MASREGSLNDTQGSQSVGDPAYLTDNTASLPLLKKLSYSQVLRVYIGRVGVSVYFGYYIITVIGGGLLVLPTLLYTRHGLRS